MVNTAILNCIANTHFGSMPISSICQPQKEVWQSALSYIQIELFLKATGNSNMLNLNSSRLIFSYCFISVIEESVSTDETWLWSVGCGASVWAGIQL